MTGDVVHLIGIQTGADEPETSRGIVAALPLLLGGLARNANRSATDARALESALVRDHDGSLLEELRSFLRGEPGSGGTSRPEATKGAHRSRNGDAILNHILGGRRGAVQTGISRASGLDEQQAGRLLILLAPVVMSALGRIKRERGLNHDAVATLLNKERAEIERGTPEIQRGTLLDYLDLENDGKVADEVAAIGARFADRFLRQAVSGV